VNNSEPGLRARRVATSIRERLTESLARDLSERALEGFVITSVVLPDDLSIAWVKGRLLVGGEDEKKRRAALGSLRRASGRLRRNLGRSLGLKRLPELRFDYDTGADAAARIEDILQEISREPKSD
jgi:ribosome-binding factor A